MSFHERTTAAAKGKWGGILQSLGVPAEMLRDRHGPCPLCGGKDRFRWDNKGGTGSYICGQCGAGDGMKLAMGYTGEDFRTLAPRIDAMLGNVRADAPARPDMTEDERRALLREVWQASRPVAPGDLVHTYLGSRGLGERIYPHGLRFAPKLRDGEGGVRPCMVAMVGVPGDMLPGGRQRYVSMHRTFLRPDGLGKAEMAAPRKLMPGSLPDGACVMLSEWTGSGPIGIAEGIETAMAASAMFGLPVWAAIGTAMLRCWEPPADADEIAIFADNDPRFGGQAAAYALAHRLSTAPAWRDVTVSVHLPRLPGTDFNDELLGKST